MATTTLAQSGDGFLVKDGAGFLMGDPEETPCADCNCGEQVWARAWRHGKNCQPLFLNNGSPWIQLIPVSDNGGLVKPGDFVRWGGCWKVIEFVLYEANSYAPDSFSGCASCSESTEEPPDGETWVYVARPCDGNGPDIYFDKSVDDQFVGQEVGDGFNVVRIGSKCFEIIGTELSDTPGINPAVHVVQDCNDDLCLGFWALVNCEDQGDYLVTDQDLAAYEGRVVRIAGDERCFGVLPTPLTSPAQSVTITETFDHCDDCGTTYLLAPCDTGAAIHTHSDVSEYVGGVVRISEGDGCYEVSLYDGAPGSPIPVTVKESYADCQECEEDPPPPGGTSGDCIGCDQV